MPTNQGVIKAALLALYASASTGEGIDADAFADGMATIIQDAIQSGDVQFPIPVQVNPATGTGGTTAIGTIL